MKRSTKCALQNCPNPAYRFGGTQHTLCREHLQWVNGAKRQGGVSLAEYARQAVKPIHATPEQRRKLQEHRPAPLAPQFRAKLARPRDREVRE